MPSGISCSNNRMFWYEEAIVEYYEPHLKVPVSKLISEKYRQLINTLMAFGWQDLDIDMWLQVAMPIRAYRLRKSCPDYSAEFVKQYQKKNPKAKHLPAEVARQELHRLRCAALAEAEKNFPAAKREAKEQLRRNLLASYCLIFADRKGKIVRQDSNPFWSAGEMKCDKDGLKIYCRAQQSPYGNGSCLVKVSTKSGVVLKAIGNYIGRPGNVEFKKYVPGSWETTITSFAKPILDAQNKK